MGINAKELNESAEAVDTRNRATSAKEVADFKANPPERVFCYPHKIGDIEVAATWMGDALSQSPIAYGHKWRDNFGGKRQSVAFVGINNRRYVGTLYGTYIRAKLVKAA